MSDALDTAIILAAGRGTRLRSIWSELPKGMIELGGERIADRSLRLLRERGIQRSVIVAGYKAESYHELATSTPGVEVIENTAYAETESMASLACALEIVDADFLLLESDLFYDPLALDTLIASEHRDVLLASSPTGATDEVWIDAPDGQLRGLTKDPSAIENPYGEFVGLLRISQALGRRMAEIFRRFQDEHGHGRMTYETDCLLTASREHPVHVCLMKDLLWGEIDDANHFERLTREIVPALAQRD
ncbi:phosphocholine cytidylyltransferase family protein [Myxococcota bacterium]|nr:phosphocholine cytidylyltransferase family protein [Myxococcota bacterium]